MLVRHSVNEEEAYRIPFESSAADSNKIIARVVAFGTITPLHDASPSNLTAVISQI
jgi:hypothetical protein